MVNLMVKSLTYQYNDLTLPLLRPKIVHSKKGSTHSSTGFYYFSKRFVDHFLGELDKMHDLNLQLERSLPMIYPPASWRSFVFGGYYLKQTKLARLLPNFSSPVKHLACSNLGQIGSTLDNLSMVKWRINRDVVKAI